MPTGKHVSPEERDRAVARIVTHAATVETEAGRLGVRASTVQAWLVLALSKKKKAIASPPPAPRSGSPEGLPEGRALTAAGEGEATHPPAGGDGAALPPSPISPAEIVAFTEGLISAVTLTLASIVRVPLGEEINKLASLTSEERASLMPGARALAGTTLLQRLLGKGEYLALAAIGLPAFAILLRRGAALKNLARLHPRAPKREEKSSVGFAGPGPPLVPDRVSA